MGNWAYVRGQSSRRLTQVFVFHVTGHELGGGEFLAAVAPVASGVSRWRRRVGRIGRRFPLARRLVRRKRSRPGHGWQMGVGGETGQSRSARVPLWIGLEIAHRRQQAGKGGITRQRMCKCRAVQTGRRSQVPVQFRTGKQAA